MTSRDEHAALVVLLRRARSWSELTDLVEERGSATAVLEEMGGTLFDLRRDDDLGAARRDLAGWRAAGLEFFSVLDKVIRAASGRCINAHPSSWCAAD